MFLRKWALCVLLWGSPLCALYNGNPGAPQIPEEGSLTTVESWMTIKLGYLGSDVFNRYMQHASKFHLWSNNGLLSLEFWNRMAVYGFVGGMRMSIDKGATHFLTQLGLCAGGGVNGIVLEKGRLIFGLDGKYFQGDPRIETTSKSKRSILYREGQVGFSCAYSLRYFYPYAGIKLSHASAKFSSPNGFTLRSKTPVGLFVGFAVTAPTTFAVTFEGEFVDELSLSGSITGRF